MSVIIIHINDILLINMINFISILSREIKSVDSDQYIKKILLQNERESITLFSSSFFIDYFCTINIQIKNEKEEKENHRRVTLLRRFQWHNVYRHIQPSH